jgi:alcohol dehydrogenase class IV
MNSLRDHSETSFYLKRYEEIAKILIGDPDATIEQGISWLNDLVIQLEIPPLSEYGIIIDDFPAIMEKAANSSSMQGNPVKLTEAEMLTILNNSL